MISTADQSHMAMPLLMLIVNASTITCPLLVQSEEVEPVDDAVIDVEAVLP